MVAFLLLGIIINIPGGDTGQCLQQDMNHSIRLQLVILKPRRIWHTKSGMPPCLQS